MKIMFYALRPFDEQQYCEPYKARYGIDYTGTPDGRDGWVQFFLLYEYEDARRTAEAAQAHFNDVDDDAGAQRAAMLRAMTEYSIAGTLGPDVPRSELHDNVFFATP